MYHRGSLHAEPAQPAHVDTRGTERSMRRQSRVLRTGRAQPALPALRPGPVLRRDAGCSKCVPIDLGELKLRHPLCLGTAVLQRRGPPAGGDRQVAETTGRARVGARPGRSRHQRRELRRVVRCPRRQRPFDEGGSVLLERRSGLRGAAVITCLGGGESVALLDGAVVTGVAAPGEKQTSTCQHGHGPMPARRHLTSLPRPGSCSQRTVPSRADRPTPGLDSAAGRPAMQHCPRGEQRRVGRRDRRQLRLRRRITVRT